ncbi:MAG TPA: bifunctional hydroxymethylpyrimidine kinase/phosphomethylpyrimidine kinase [Thiobacillaceae bacterium]|nr:bifunctional hydroxymethylpyrimidine kinase/phosphomethylpyrimidine kinase [Thiobacillaceae bacterium]
MKPTPPLVLVFAASDPTGGAGVQADLLTLAAMGCHPLSSITALTIQDTRGVDDVLPIDAEWVADQARMVLEDMRVDAFKLGMLGSVEAIAAIAEVLSDYPDIPVVLDPVLASGAGDELANEEMISAMKEMLLPQATVITPNSTEARRLAWHEDDEGELSLELAAARLLAFGCEYVLITGTHENTPRVINTLFTQQGVVRQDAWDRLSGTYHGSGCTLASGLAAALAFGQDMSQAVRDAQEFTYATLKAAFRPGMGQHLPQRFFWARESGPEESA